MRICWSNSGDSHQAAHVLALIIVPAAHVPALDNLISSSCVHIVKILSCEHNELIEVI